MRSAPSNLSFPFATHLNTSALQNKPIAGNPQASLPIIKPGQREGSVSYLSHGLEVMRTSHLPIKAPLLHDISNYFGIRL